MNKNLLRYDQIAVKLTAEDVKAYKSLRGWLKKKSPNILKGYQKRFFMIVDDGNILAWCDDESISAKPKGSIDIHEIESIKRSSTTDFEIKYGGRFFQLRAENEGERERWIKGLNSLQEYLNKTDEISKYYKNFIEKFICFIRHVGKN